MRRIIEELIEKRKKNQQKLQNTLLEISHILEDRSLLKKKSRLLSEKFTELNQDITELITSQDKEWDAYANNHATMVFKSLQWKIEKLQSEYSHLKTILTNFLCLEKSLQKLLDSLDDKIDPRTVNKIREIKNQLSPYQYSDFEQRFRGDEPEVKKKLEKYLSIFTDTDNILDIGCGRGEFLQLLKEKNISALGIDISDSMLTSAIEKGLECEKKDALEFLKNTESNSLGGIFSSQVIEHFQPEYLREVVVECYRVLKADSPIVLETINPLSLFALSQIFFLDVSHQKPLHPEYMRYLMESSGFRSVEIIYSEELAEEKLADISPEHQIARAFNTNVDKLNKILFSSAGYAVTAIK